MPPPHFSSHASSTSPACTPLQYRHSRFRPMTTPIARIVNHTATFVTFAVNSSWRTTPVKEDVARRCGIWKTGERWSAKLGEFEGGGARRVRCAVCEAYGGCGVDEALLCWLPRGGTSKAEGKARERFRVTSHLRITKSYVDRWNIMMLYSFPSHNHKP
jgi:hypothetical protein